MAPLAAAAALFILSSQAAGLAVAQKHIVLVGGGHAHVQVIRALNAAARPPNVRVSLIDPQSAASYSGMVPGCVAGLYTAAETQIRLEPLAHWASIDFLQTRVTEVDPVAQEVRCADGTTLAYDALSLDIGSTTRGAAATPGVTEHAICTRPISELVSQIEAAEQSFGTGNEAVRAVVVGGGAAGIELALALRARWGRLLADDNGDRLSVALVHGGAELLPDESCACRAAVRAALAQRRIAVEHGCRVAAVRADAVELEPPPPPPRAGAARADGRALPATHVLWATGAAAHPLAAALARQGLATTPAGWVRVRPTLQAVGHANLFAAGDCAQIEGLPDRAAPPPKAGVFAVRAGPVLVHNLLAAVGHGELRAYAPQRDFLKLLMCGDGSALGFRFGLALRGPWVWRLKDHIDVGFMRLFAADALPPLPQSAGAGAEVAQFDAALERPPRATPAAAAALLARDDAEVSHLAAFGVLRDMATDDAYREAVLTLMSSGGGMGV